MSEDSTTQCLLFPGIFRKPVVARFDQREGSSDGGALLLKAADRQYGLVAGLPSCLRDERQAGKVDHSLCELAAQRVFSIACGYPDANDSDRLSGDPIYKLLLDRDPGSLGMTPNCFYGASTTHRNPIVPARSRPGDMSRYFSCSSSRYV
jgi:hypothetical protein